MNTPLKRHLWFLRKTPALGSLPPEALQQLAEAAELCERPRRTTLYLAGDFAEHVYFLHGGRVHSLHVTNSTRTLSLGLHGPTDVFGECSLWTSSPREDMAVTMTAAVYSRISRALLRLILDDHRHVEQRLFEQALVRREGTLRRLCAALTRSVRARLAGQLIDLAENGHDTADGRELGFPLTQHELAALIGTTRETVSIELGRLEASHLISRRGRHIVLCDVPRLRIYARDDPPLRQAVVRGPETSGVSVAVP